MQITSPVWTRLHYIWRSRRDLILLSSHYSIFSDLLSAYLSTTMQRFYVALVILLLVAILHPGQCHCYYCYTKIKSSDAASLSCIFTLLNLYLLERRERSEANNSTIPCTPYTSPITSAHCALCVRNTGCCSEHHFEESPFR